MKCIKNYVSKEIFVFGLVLFSTFLSSVPEAISQTNTNTVNTLSINISYPDDMNWDKWRFQFYYKQGNLIINRYLDKNETPVILSDLSNGIGRVSIFKYPVIGNQKRDRGHLNKDVTISGPTSINLDLKTGLEGNLVMSEDLRKRVFFWSVLFSTVLFESLINFFLFTVLFNWFSFSNANFSKILKVTLFVLPFSVGENYFYLTYYSGPAIYVRAFSALLLPLAPNYFFEIIGYSYLTSFVPVLIAIKFYLKETWKKSLSVAGLEIFFKIFISGLTSVILYIFTVFFNVVALSVVRILGLG